MIIPLIFDFKLSYMYIKLCIKESCKLLISSKVKDILHYNLHNAGMDIK